MPLSLEAPDSKAHVSDNSPAINPYVFLVGSPRSGTTMLKRMVAAHSQIVITRETHWIPRYIERSKGVDDKGLVLPKLIDKLFEHHRFAQMKVSREQIADFMKQHECIYYRDLVAWIFDRYCKRKGKPLCGDKTPKYVRKLPTLLSLWPSARVIHIVRDGRNVCLSLMNWRMAHKAAGQFSTWIESPVITAALWWKSLVSAGCHDGPRMAGSNYLEIGYESLVAYPEAHCRKIAKHLNVEYQPEMAAYYAGKTNADPRLSANAAWLPPTRGLRDWQSQMAEADIARFEAVAGDLLNSLGYPLACTAISTEIAGEVRDVARRFNEDAIARGWQRVSTVV